ncbi:MAG: hypothetical protein C0424_12395 [Sphingobacteriaceae bacterium]|nr:hypothetical protein [Sphingobacteriaceae bacterium]
MFTLGVSFAQPTNIMKKFALFMLVGLLANQLAFAQPVAGQKYLELRNLYWQTVNRTDNQPFGLDIASINSGINIGAGKMFNDHYSAGLLLFAGYNQNRISDNLGGSSFENALGFGLQVYGRRWYPLAKKMRLHADMAAGYQAQRPQQTGRYESIDRIFLELSPGFSWFFHPRWAFQARMPLLNLQYQSTSRPNTREEFTLLSFQPNIFSAQWGMTFWLK